MKSHYPFILKPLPYSYNSLEPYIDTETMTIHHDKHLKAYVDNLNATLKNYPEYQDWTLTKLIMNINTLPKEIQTAVNNNAGGVFNHNLYFDLMSPYKSTLSNEELIKAIGLNFDSLENLKAELKKSGLAQFGSGWAWLVSDEKGNLKIVNTANQDTPLPSNLTPILLVDVWEHAYYLKYQNRRSEYIDAWFNTIDWGKVAQRYEKILH